MLAGIAKPLGGTLVWRAPELLQSSVVSFHVSAGILKFLHKAIDSQVSELCMFRRLRHPNIVLFYGAARLPGTYELMLSMKHVEGVSLFRLALPPLPSWPHVEPGCWRAAGFSLRPPLPGPLGGHTSVPRRSFGND